MRVQSYQSMFNQKLLREANLRDSKKKGKARGRLRKENNAAGKEYMRSEHEYYMIRGEDKTPIKRRMLGREAKLQNSLNQLKFGSGEHDRLIKWVYIKEDVAQNEKQE